MNVAQEPSAIPWREGFSEITDQALPGVCLRRSRAGMTQAVLAEATGIPTRHISEMENGKHPIGKTCPSGWVRRWASGIKCSCNCGELLLM